MVDSILTTFDPLLKLIVFNMMRYSKSFMPWDTPETQIQKKTRDLFISLLTYAQK